MRLLFPVLFILVLIASPAFAVPDAPSAIWFEGNETLHYSRGNFSVNWTAVTNEPLSNYTVYIIDALTNNTLRFFTSTGPAITGLLFSGDNGINYTFKVSTLNASGTYGPNATSDWIYVDMVPPVISFIPPTPETNKYVRNSTLTLLLSSNELLSSIALNWNNVTEPANITYVGWGPGIYLYYLSKNITSEGRYSYSLTVNDTATNSASGETRIITYDVTPPLLTLISPQNITYNSTKMSLNYTVYDMSPVSCKYSYISMNTWLPNCINLTFIAINNVSQTLILWANDSAGNANSTSATFFVNETIPISFPVISSPHPANGTVFDAPSISGKVISSFSIATDKAAECRYSFVRNTSFENMTGRFDYTNSTIHNATIALSDGMAYNRSIRCKSLGGDANTVDYYLQFFTAPFKNALKIDPDGIVVKNGTLALELIGGKQVSFNISIENDAMYALAPNITSAGSGAPYLNTTIPSSIPANSTISMMMSARPGREGFFNATIIILGGMFSDSFQINMTVYSDYISQLNDLKFFRQSISARLYSLQSKGAAVDASVAEAERLQTELNDAVSLYNSGRFGEGRASFLRIQSDVNSLGATVTALESQFAPPPDISNGSDGGVPPPHYNATGTKTGAEGDGVGTSTWVIILVILLVVVVAFVLATSIMPDDEVKPPPKRRFLSEEMS